ncbi:MAG: ABC transporter transmembrane domain-containing protein [Candidatus Competibacterales bacterium]
MAEERRRYGAAILTMAAATAATFAVPLFAAYAIDGIVAGGAFAPRPPLDYLLPTASGWWPLVWAAGYTVLFTGVAGVFQYLRDRLAAVAAQRLIQKLRNRLYGRLERLPLVTLDGYERGDLVQRCTSDVDTVQQFLVQQVVEIGRTGALVVLVIPLLFWLDPALAAASVLLLPAIGGFAWLFHRRLRPLFLASDEAEGKLTAVLQENLSGIRMVRAFARQDYERAKFAGHNQTYRDKRRAMIEGLGVYWAVGDVLCLAQVGITLLAGARLVQGEAEILQDMRC